jgi:hypothetical protein
LVQVMMFPGTALLHSCWKNLHALPFINYQLISSEPSDSHNDICVSKWHFPWIRDCMNPFDAKLKLKVLWKLPAQTTRYPGLIESEPSHHLLRSSGNISIGKSVSSYQPIWPVAVLKRAPIGPHRLLAVKGLKTMVSVNVQTCKYFTNKVKHKYFAWTSCWSRRVTTSTTVYSWLK